MAKECSHPTPFDGVSFNLRRFFFGVANFRINGKNFGRNGLRHFFHPPGGSRYTYLCNILTGEGETSLKIGSYVILELPRRSG